MDEPVQRHQRGEGIAATTDEVRLGRDELLELSLSRVPALQARVEEAVRTARDNSAGLADIASRLERVVGEVRALEALIKGLDDSRVSRADLLRSVEQIQEGLTSTLGRVVNTRVDGERAELEERLLGRRKARELKTGILEGRGPLGVALGALAMAVVGLIGYWIGVPAQRTPTPTPVQIQAPQYPPYMYPQPAPYAPQPVPPAARPRTFNVPPEATGDDP